MKMIDPNTSFGKILINSHLLITDGLLGTYERKPNCPVYVE